jgi:phosphocarrier protein HPr
MFNANIYLIYNEDKVNAKSLLGILTLAASVGNEIILQASGDDEQEAITAISDLFNRKFDEES